ncbi:MAG: hypothetical protein IKT33_04105, partial [Clostridia bacterium]|nr:hypothetical protein [Clostridia bacterium]
LDALKTTVKVNPRGGIKYLNITDSFTLDSITAATYDLTVRTDELLTNASVWTNGVLNYTFLYQDVYYKIFDDETISYINMEGGKAQLEFKLTYLGVSEPVNGYYTYWLKITVAVVVKVPDVDPFYEFSGARLYVTEDLTGSALVKTPMSDSAELNLIKDGVSNITLSHFAETNAVAANKNAVSLTEGQTNSGVIYLDDNSLGGILVVYPTPYFANITNIDLSTKKVYEQDVILGYDLSGKPIKDKVTYSIGFTQMVYNEDQKFYQPYISGSSTPKMISSWSSAGGYKWNGKYYFKTYVVCDSNTSQRLDDGAQFTVEVAIKGENNTTKIAEEMILVAKYKNSFVITPDDDVEDYAVCTMQQIQYQALGTTAVYDIALPLDCNPNYAGFTFNGISSASKTIETSQAIVTIDSVAQVISVYLKADSKIINQTLEVRIPYHRQGDYVNPYLSVVIVPVYFEFESLEVVDHYESPLQLKNGEANKLKYSGLFRYDTSMLNSSLSEKIKAFNYSLQAGTLFYFDYETAGEISVEFCYNYENGVPVLAKNGICRHVQVFEYDVITENAVTDKRTEYLAVGTSKTFTFENWDSLYANTVYLKDGDNYDAISDYWERNLKVVGRNNVEITVSLINESAKPNTDAYAALINQKEIVIQVYSTGNTITPQLELTIIPVYFTINEFKLQNNPVNPIIALTKPVTVTVAASGIDAASDAEILNKISAFNTDLLALQNNLADTNDLIFSRVANDNGFLNFNFDSSTRTLTRADTQNPTSAVSYLLVSTSIKYVNGLPTIVSNGKKISTYFTVCTFGEESEDDSEEEFELAPEGRTRTVAQAIGTTVRYNISLPGIVYDSVLVQCEVDANNRVLESSNDNWKAYFDLQDGVITVVINKDTELFNKTLRIMAYSRDGRLVYILNIIPAYFTVEQILLADHLSENPILVKSGAVNWVENLELDFAAKHAGSLENFDLTGAISNFRAALMNSSMVSRLENKDNVVISAGINYINGIPTLVNWYNAKIKLQNSYSYLFYDGVPEVTKVQFLGQETIYNINRTFSAIKIFSEGNWIDLDNNPYWSIIRNDEKSIKVILSDDSSSVIGSIIRVGIFQNYDDVDPIYILNIIPAYFVVEDITVKGQTVEDRYVELYFGEAVDSPAKLVFDAILNEDYSRKAEYNIPSLVNNFRNEFQNVKAGLIGRYYDSDTIAGDLLVTLYLNYENGCPVLVDASESGNDFVVRLDANFTYKIYKKGNGNNDFPLKPTGPRTRTEIQAVGTINNYVIDLDKELLLDDSNLPNGVVVNLNNNVLTVELSEDADSLLKQADIEINLYAESVLVFVLEIQPVLYEVVGVKTDNFGQPIYLSSLNLDVANISYCAIAKYNHEVSYEGKNVQYYIEQFNATLNSDLVFVELSNQYLKINLAVDYGVSGSKLRSVPALLNVNKYPLNVIESYIEFTDNPQEQSTTAVAYQAVGTTEIYYLGGSTFAGAEVTGISDSSVTASIMQKNASYILEVSIDANVSLIGDNITIKIKVSDKEYTLIINPVWFVVEGFEVVNHPERHMWLINMNTEDELDNLLFQVRSRHANNADDNFKAQLQAQISSFNQKLIDEWNQMIERYTIGSSYLVVRAAVDYKDGIASLINIDDAEATQFVRDVFEYVIYSDADYDVGEIRPVPAQPSVMGSTQVRQVIGTKKNYSVNVNGEASYKYLWVENAGDLKNTYTDANSGLLQIEYEDVIVYVDSQNKKIQVELVANYSEILTKNIRIYVPYLASYSRGIWYSHCIEITPVLFELEGWTVVAKNPSLNTLIADKNNEDYLLLTDKTAEFNYVAKIKKGEITNNILIDLFEQSIAELETNAVENIETSVEQGHNISFNGPVLSTNYPDRKLENIVGLSFYVTYKNGIPEFDKKKLTTNEVYNQISISTGYTVDEWEEIEKGLLANGVAYTIQAIGTVQSNILEISNAVKLFTNDIKVVNRLTKEPVKIPGERENLISVKCENFDKATNSLVIKIALAPVDALRFENIEILIPYAKETNPEKAEYVFSYRVTPVLYIVNGVYLVDAENNFVELGNKDVKLELGINIVACDDYNLRGSVAFRSQNLETDINDAINNNTLNFVVSDGEDDDVDDINVAIKSYDGLRWISRIDNTEVLNYIKASLNLDYQDGLPQLITNGSFATNSVPVEIQVQTKMIEISDGDLVFPDPDPNPNPNPDPEPNPGDNEDIYKKPIALGGIEITQLIGSTDRYTLSDISGEVLYQNLWVSNAGTVVAPFENASMEMTKINEFLSIAVDQTNNTLTVKLEPNSAYLLEPINIYVPYIDEVDGEDVWYSYCVQITPALFKLNGWTIQGIGENANHLINKDEHYLLTTAEPVGIKYIADIEHCIQDNNSTLLARINHEIETLENDAAKYMNVTTTFGNNIDINGTILTCKNLSESDLNRISLVTYLIYKNGIPKLVESSKQIAYSEITVSTSFTPEEWNDIILYEKLRTDEIYAVQAVGTLKVYDVKIDDAFSINASGIEVLNKDKQEPISDLVEVDYYITTELNNELKLRVELKADANLFDTIVEIKIPYKKEESAFVTNYFVSYYITPVAFVVDGFYLSTNASNKVDVTEYEVALDLRVKANHTSSAEFYNNTIKALIEKFEKEVNDEMSQIAALLSIQELSGDKNIQLVPSSGKILIRKLNNKSAINTLSGEIIIGYEQGIAHLYSVNSLTDALISLNIQVTTREKTSEDPIEPDPTPDPDPIDPNNPIDPENPSDPDKKEYKIGQISKSMQSIGTSRDYKISFANEENLTFYLDRLEVKNGGPKRGEDEYENFDIKVKEDTNKQITVSFTLMATAKTINDWIDIYIPYTANKDGVVNDWFVYILRVKPVLFEVTGWALKVGDEIVNDVVLNRDAVELYFTPQIIRCENDACYYPDELEYIRNSIKRLEMEINTYDPTKNDKYTYMVIENIPEVGSEVNYDIVRDDNTNTSYLVRTSNDVSTTVMNLSVNIAYGISDFDKSYVGSAQAVEHYDETIDTIKIWGQVSVRTMDRSIFEDSTEELLIPITQETANQLMNLQPGFDYILMSDIYLEKIPGLTDGKWKPVSFPSNTTLDGNNFKIYFGDAGFDLSSKTPNIGLFTQIPEGSVVKNVQIVIERGTVNDPYSTLTVNLQDYGSGSVNIGLLAGVNNGIITNCAVLSEWQFEMRNLTEVINPVTGTYFEDVLPFNKDGHVFDENYFYELGMTIWGEVVVTNVYNKLGYRVEKDFETGKYDKVIYDVYHNVANWIEPDRTNVARYDDYTTIELDPNSSKTHLSKSMAKFYVQVNNNEVDITLGGLVGINAYMVTNSRVLVDVELYGPEVINDTGLVDEINVASSIVGGFAGVNDGTITSSFFRDGSVINNANAANKTKGSLLGGFVGQNNGNIMQSYAMGCSTNRDEKLNNISAAGIVKTIRNSLGGFVHVNSGHISDCLVNMVIEKTGPDGSAGGFVFRNKAGATITNCVENNNVIVVGTGLTTKYYAPFIQVNGDGEVDKNFDKIDKTGLNNLIYAGNVSPTAVWGDTIKHLTNNNADKAFNDIKNYSGFSIGYGELNVTDKNTIWKMTGLGPMLRAANEIAVSSRKYSYDASMYLYKPGSAKNPYLVWNEDQFDEYVYKATAHAVQSDKDTEEKGVSDIERNRQNNHLRLVDNFALTKGIQGSQKIIYTGTLEGNGLTISGINSTTNVNRLATMGLFGKTEYATIRNINLKVGSIISEARYVGAIAGIAINTNFVDVNVLSESNSGLVSGANIVGGFVGLNIINDPSVENYNIHSSLSVEATFGTAEDFDENTNLFTSGEEYV